MQAVIAILAALPHIARLAREGGKLIELVRKALQGEEPTWQDVAAAADYAREQHERTQGNFGPTAELDLDGVGAKPVFEGLNK